jgi:hypothetical protein
MQLYRYFVRQPSELRRSKSLCCFSTNVYCCKRIFRYRLSPETFGSCSYPYIFVSFCSGLILRTSNSTCCLEQEADHAYNLLLCYRKPSGTPKLSVSQLNGHSGLSLQAGPALLMEILQRVTYRGLIIAPSY